MSPPSPAAALGSGGAPRFRNLKRREREPTETPRARTLRRAGWAFLLAALVLVAVGAWLVVTTTLP